MSVRDRALEESRDFLRSRVVFTAASLDLFTRLDDEPADAAAVASAVGSDPRATTRLLDCLVAFGLLDKEGGTYRTTEAGAVMSSRHPGSVRPMLLHRDRLWDRWSDLTETVRRGHHPRSRKVHRDAEHLRVFIGAMHAVSRDPARDFVAGFGPGRFRRLLDVGGGSGVYTIAFLQQNPEAEAVLFDRPDVVGIAADHLREAGLEDRVRLVAGDYLEDELPRGCDAALLSAVVHENSLADNAGLFAKIHRALEPGGVLIVRDYVMNEDRTEPPGGALFALNMLVVTGSGDTYTFTELQEALRGAGFADVELFRGSGRMDDRVEARKPY